MKPIAAFVSRALMVALPFGAALAASAPGDAQAQYIAPPAPPAAYIATVSPEYFEGRPVYFWNNQWYYRDAHGWNFYRNEPGYLHDRRGHWNERVRYHYHR
jgi:hypothetical protein